jgi:2-polyprenyl-3-methyl-5-hydroxy-6-metoxy-1,4-benzoquinol methylase
MALNLDTLLSILEEMDDEYERMAPKYNERWIRGDVEDEAILKDLLNLSSGSQLSILDVGCGTGRFLAAARLLTTGELAGLDNCEAMMEKLPRQFDNDKYFTLLKCNIQALPSLPPHKLARLNNNGKGWDIITCMHVLSHSRGQEGPILRALNNLLEPTASRLVFDIERTPVSSAALTGA